MDDMRVGDAQLEQEVMDAIDVLGLGIVARILDLSPNTTIRFALGLGSQKRTRAKARAALQRLRDAISGQ
jgi:hypothetical protein